MITSLYVAPDATLRPCPVWPEVLGHVREGLGQVFRSARRREVVGLRHRDRKGCQGCRLFQSCVFCPGVARASTGSAVERNQWACRTAEFYASVFLGEGALDGD